MANQKPTSVPPPSTQKFENAIAHPALWLWDSWTAEIDGVAHLYCLALNRIDSAGDAVLPEHRNDYPFHIRHFTSEDGGRTWKDEGAFFEPSGASDGAFARNVWSGGVLARNDHDWIAAFTGLREAGAERPFLQSICLGRSDNAYSLDAGAVVSLSCPYRDYDHIRAAGYYLPARETLGAYEGEEGGPILAWRDPFILDAGDRKLEVFWSAKIAPARPAVAHATVRRTANGFEIEKLHAPITLPDDAAFTQAEVPKICRSAAGDYFMMISACDRLNESQPAHEVTKVLRLYRAAAIRGPWKPAYADGASLIPDTENLFGASILKTDPGAAQFHLLAPYSEYEPTGKQLTFAPIKMVDVPLESQELAPAAQKQT
ncbi:MAG: hypothetical protein IPK75_00025 [Acidobacteria bacterium]|nr:hypothetical protein [Acidobacteriota bacterium]